MGKKQTGKRASRGDAKARRTAKKESQPGATVPHTATAADVKRTLTELPVEQCYGTDANCRTFDPKHPRFLELVPDVKANGVLQPVLARLQKTVQVKGTSLSRKCWEILAGRRRLEAAKAAGLETIPAVVYNGLSDAEAHKITVKENHNRDDLTPLEESRAVRLILDDNGFDYKAAASFFGRPERWVHLRAKLGDLDPAWKKLIAKRELGCSIWTAGHLELIARFPKNVQKSLARNYAGDWSLKKRFVFSVKDLQKWLDDGFLRRLKSAPFDIEDATLVKSAPACSRCKKRASCQGRLFLAEEEDDLRKKNDQCLDAACWDAKVTANAKARLKALEAEHGKVLLVSEGSAYRGSQRERMIQSVYGRSPDMDELGWNKERIARKKADKAKAQIALVADGPQAGKVVHILPEKSAGSTSSRSRGRAKGTPTPLKDRRKVLESKRWHETLKRMREALAGLTHVDLPGCKTGGTSGRLDHVATLAVVFGTSREHSEYGSHYALDDDGDSSADRIDPYQLLRNFTDKPREELTALLWSTVRPVLFNRLEPHASVTQVSDDAIAEGKALAALVGLKWWEDFYAEACEVYKEPKGWAKLNADGTSKKQEAKSEKRKAKKPSRKGAKTQRKKKATKKTSPVIKGL